MDARWMKRLLMTAAALAVCVAMTHLVLEHLAEVSGQADDRPRQLVSASLGLFVAPVRFMTYYAAALAWWCVWLGVAFTAGIPSMPVFLVGLVLPTAAFWYAMDRLCARTLARARLARDVAEIMEKDR